MPVLAFSTASSAPAIPAKAGLLSDRPTPSDFRSKVWVPVSGLSSSTDLASAKTAPWMSLRAEVRMESL